MTAAEPDVEPNGTQDRDEGMGTAGDPDDDVAFDGRVGDIDCPSLSEPRPLRST